MSDTARARHSDPETSHAAAASVRDIPQGQAHVLALLREFGHMADEELVARYGRACTVDHTIPPQSPSGIRTRRAELTNKGLVVYTGQRRRLASGRMAMVWAATKPTRETP